MPVTSLATETDGIEKCITERVIYLSLACKLSGVARNSSIVDKETDLQHPLDVVLAKVQVVKASQTPALFAIDQGISAKLAGTEMAVIDVGEMGIFYSNAEHWSRFL